MKKIKSKNDLYLLILSILMIIFLILSSSLPFVIKQGNAIYMVHIFNPITHDFDGRIESIYGPILTILTFISLIPNFFKVTFMEEKRALIYSLSIKITVFLSFVFSVTNYFKIIYPNSFIISGDVSVLQSGFYSFIVFLLLYILDAISMYFSIKKIDSDRRITFKKDKAIYFNILIICAYIGLFAFISTFFVPYYRNYLHYMREPGFETILDKRTSINFYLPSVFDENFNYSILSLIMIWLNIYTPLVIIFKRDDISFIKIFIANAVSIIVLFLAVFIGCENINHVEPILVIKIDPVCCVFIGLLLFVYLLNIIFSILIVKDSKNKEETFNNEISTIS